MGWISCSTELQIHKMLRPYQVSHRSSTYPNNPISVHISVHISSPPSIIHPCIHPPHPCTRVPSPLPPRPPPPPQKKKRGVPSSPSTSPMIPHQPNHTTPSPSLRPLPSPAAYPPPPLGPSLHPPARPTHPFTCEERGSAFYFPPSPCVRQLRSRG